MKTSPPGREEAIALLAANPNLLRRPLLVEGGEILFGFDPDAYARIRR
jgi:arsenate reductase-like glutaredoxin family protein